MTEGSVGCEGRVSGDKLGSEAGDVDPSLPESGKEGREGGTSEASMSIGYKASIIDVSDGGDGFKA